MKHYFLRVTEMEFRELCGKAHLVINFVNSTGAYGALTKWAKDGFKDFATVRIIPKNDIEIENIEIEWDSQQKSMIPLFEEYFKNNRVVIK